MPDILYIEDGRIKEAMDIRPVLAENMSPMITHAPYFVPFANGHVQVLVDFLGWNVWVNVKKHNVIRGLELITVPVP